MIQYTFPFDFILSLRILPMNIMLFLSLFTFLHANNNIQGTLDIDLRQRVVNDNQIRIVVQIDNNSKRDTVPDKITINFTTLIIMLIPWVS